MKINHNIAALNAYRNLAVNNSTTAKSLEKLSSGLRINRASDDAAGLAISEKMRSQIRGLDMAERNALDGVSFVQTAEGALSSVHTMLQRMRELAVQAANDSNTEVDRDAIQQEINQLTNEINRISNATEFNTKKLLDGTLSNEATPITIGDAGKGAVFTGGAADLTANLSSTGATVTFNVNGTDYTISNTALKTFDGSVTAEIPSALQTLVENAVDGSGNTLSTVAAVSLDVNNKIIIRSNKSGENTNVTFNVNNPTDATDLANVQSAFGLPDMADVGTATEAAAITSVKPAPTTDLGIISENAQLTITIDGINYHLDKTALTNASGTGKTTDDLINAINKAINPGGIANPPGIAGKDANGNIQITSAIIGTNSNVSISITGDVTTGIGTAFGFSSVTPGENAVQGIYQFQFSNKDITIDGETLPYFNATNPTGWTDAATLKAKIEANPTLNAKYDVGIVNGEIQLKQKVGQESTVAPKITNGKLLALQIGANQGQTVSLEIKNMQSAAIGISRTDNGGEQEITLSNGEKLTVWYTNSKQSNNGINNELTDYTIDVSTHEKASAAITVFNDAIERVSAERSRMGAVQNRLEQTVDNLKYMSENTTAAESRIRDVDMALEMAAYTKNNILVQSAQAMLAQANQLPQGVLQLLK